MTMKMVVMNNKLEINLRIAEQRAADLVEHYGIASPEHIRIRDIAYDLGATVIEGTLKGAAASLVRSGKKATIRVSSGDSYENHKRFSMAHELGHFILHRGHTMQRVCSDEDMMNWYHTSEETEANFFAGELILPKTLIEKRCDVKEVDFTPIKQIANDYRTSLTATAIRFVRFCPESCAVVFSKDGKVKWFYTSEDWWSYIAKNQKLDNRTLAYDFFKGISLPDKPVGVDADAWVNGDGLSELVEHSIGSKYLNFVLTILWIKP